MPRNLYREDSVARSIPDFQKISTNIKEVDRMTEKLSLTLGVLLAKQIIDGELLEDVLVTTGATRTIPHTLQRPVTGYIIVKRNANAVIWDSESLNLRKDLFLDLNSSATVTVSIWVF